MPCRDDDYLLSYLLLYLGSTGNPVARLSSPRLKRKMQQRKKRMYYRYRIYIIFSPKNPNDDK